MSSAEGPQIELFDRLIVQQFEVDQVKLAELAHYCLCTLSEGDMHHQNNDLGNLLFDPIEHFLDDLDRLRGQEVPLILLLVAETAAPEKQPAHEDVGLLAFHIKLDLQLLSSR